MNPFSRSLLALGFILSGFALCGGQSATTSTAKDPRIPPELVGGPWLNTEGGKPVTLASRQGKVTLVAYWTFACSNCQANMPAYRRLLEKYRPKGVELVSIHTPELKIERDVEEVKKHLAKFKIDYPVLIDGQGDNWKRWVMEVWPTIFVLDKQGRVRYRWIGELAWQGAKGEEKVASVIEDLLREK